MVGFTSGRFASFLFKRVFVWVQTFGFLSWCLYIYIHFFSKIDFSEGFSLAYFSRVFVGLLAQIPDEEGNGVMALAFISSSGPGAFWGLFWLHANP